MRRRTAARYRIWTRDGTASYENRSHAVSAARWVAKRSGEVVAIANERTGERWDMSPDGRLAGAA